MSEVQNHGFVFESWVKKVLGVDGKETKYTQKWDVEGEKQISIKFMGQKNSLEFSSAVRFWETTTEFTMIIGRWKQIGSQKILTSVDELEFTKDVLQKLKGNISLQEIKDFDAKIRSFPAGREGQIAGSAFAKEWKNSKKHKCGLLNIAAKLDSKNQRRIQVNLAYNKYVELFGAPCGKTVLRGQSFNSPIESGVRTYNKK